MYHPVETVGLPESQEAIDSHWLKTWIGVDVKIVVPEDEIEVRHRAEYDRRYHHDAEDLTQAFFGKLLEKNYLGEVSRERGRFRTFLLASLKHFLANEWDKRSAKKRGGGIVFVPLDSDFSDRFEREALPSPAESCTPEELFDRRWARTVLERALAALEARYRKTEQADLFEALRPSLALGKPVTMASGEQAKTIEKLLQGLPFFGNLTPEQLKQVARL